MSSKIDISVIIPMYNAEKYIQETLLSILGQSHRNFEIICVDDGSTDTTVQICMKIQEAYEHIVVIHQDNQNAGAARNTGMKYAKGEYILFFDADDIMEKDMLESLYSEAQKDALDIVICNAYTFDSDTYERNTDKNYCTSKSKFTKVFSISDCRKSILQLTSPVPWNKLFRKEFIMTEGIQFQNIKRSNDEYFSALAMILAKRIKVINKRLVGYRLNNENSLQGGIGKEHVSYEFAEAMSFIKESLIKRNLYPLVECSFLDKCVSAAIAALNKQKKYVSYEKMYFYIKNQMFPQFGIDKTLSIENQRIQGRALRIMDMEPQEYLFYLLHNNEKRDSLLIPYKEIGTRKRIVIYGAGKSGRAFYKKLLESDFYEVVAWVDSNYTNIGDSRVHSPETICDTDYDIVLIAVYDDEIQSEITQHLCSLGVSMGQIVKGKKNEG